MKKPLALLAFLMLFINQSEAHVNLNYPIGGETFGTGLTINIQWEALVTHDPINWDLYYSTDGGIVWIPIQLDIFTSTLNMLWVVPATVTTEARIKIVQDNVDTDYEAISSNFSIETALDLKENGLITNVSVFPNPMINYMTFQINNLGNEIYSLTIYDLQGRNILNISGIKDEEVNIYRNNMSGGFYFYHLISDGEIRARGKFEVK